MNRRDALLTTGSMVVSASLGAIACGGQTAIAQNQPKTPPSVPPPPAARADASLFDAAHACIAKGDACISHCIALLSSGDTSMAECARAVKDMHAVMIGLASLAASGSPRLPAYARVAMDLCKDCEAACRKHADHHTPCRECAEACTRTIAACQKIAT